jgi:hypothetical protein
MFVEPFSLGFNLGRINFRGRRVKMVSDLTASNALDLQLPCILVFKFTGHWLARFHSKELHFLTRIDGIILPATLSFKSFSWKDLGNSDANSRHFGEPLAIQWRVTPHLE